MRIKAISTVFAGAAVVALAAVGCGGGSSKATDTKTPATFRNGSTGSETAAAAATGRLLGLDAATMLHAFGSAGTQAAGLWEFLRDAADSKQLHTAKAAADGLQSAWLARAGFTVP